MPFSGDDLHWRQEVTIPAGQTSAPIMIPAGLRNITATLVPGGGGSAKVQHSTSYSPLVEATPNDANVRWVDWDAGVVTVAKSAALLSPVTAIRGTATTQPAVLEVVGHRKG